MNVFDDEAGPLCDQNTAQTLMLFAAAHFSLEDLRAYWREIEQWRPN